MSNLAINIRLIYWHWQVTFDGVSTFKINRHIYGNKKAWLFPIAIYDFSPLKIRTKTV